MPGLTDQVARHQRTIGPFLIAAVALGLAGLPLAVWLDLRDLSERILRGQAGETSRIIDDMRRFYGSDVVGQVLKAEGAVAGARRAHAEGGAKPCREPLALDPAKRTFV